MSRENAATSDFISGFKEYPREKRGHPEDHFEKHGPDGIDFLRGFIDDPDRKKASNAAYLMAEVIRKLRWDGREEAEHDLRQGLVRLSSENDPEIRRKSIIALGWVGTENEIPLLCEHLLNDVDSLCRAWSASSFLQMCGRVPAEIMQPMIRDVLLQCLLTERTLSSAVLPLNHAATSGVKECGCAIRMSRTGTKKQ